MRRSKMIFAVLMITAFVFYAGNALFRSGATVWDAMKYAFPSREGMDYYANEAGFAALPLRVALLENHARLQNLMGKTESGGLDVIAANDNTYVSGNAQQWSYTDVEQFVIKLYRLQEALEEQELPARVIYISAQPQIIDGYTEPLEAFPLPDESKLMEAMLYYLRAYAVDFLDTQFSLRKTTLPLSEYIYKTDTIWTTQASFLTAQALVGKLTSQYDAAIDPDWHYFNKDNFDMVTYENLFMGSKSMKTGEPFTGKENFSIISPSYETSFTYEASGYVEKTVTGTFTETLLNLEHLEPADPYLYGADAVYMDGGAYYQRVITNNDRADASNALFIHDSSALPFAAFMSLGFHETHMYWPAVAPDTAEFELIEYIAAYDIEYVFFLAECNYYAMEELFRIGL